MQSRDGQSDVTVLMDAAAQGDATAADQLLPLAYEQLRRAAQQCLRDERVGHTLSATALVHEAYLNLVGPREIPWASRAHFYVAAAEAMRRILLDHARRRARVKRGGGRRRLDLRSVAELAAGDSTEILEFDELFRRLESELPEAAAVVRLRFYAGLSIVQTAKALELSTNTIDRRWALGRAWLFRAMNEQSGPR